MCHEWNAGQRVMLNYKIGEFDHGEIQKVDEVTADKTQYLLILHEEERYKKMAWVWESRILGLCYDQLEMAL